MLRALATPVFLFSQFIFSSRANLCSTALCSLRINNRAASTRHCFLAAGFHHPPSSAFLAPPFFLAGSTSGIGGPSRILLAAKRSEGDRPGLVKRQRRRKTPASKTPAGSVDSATAQHVDCKGEAAAPLARVPARLLMSEGDSASGSRKKPSFYAVAVGRQRGIYSTWQQCSAQVTGHRGAIYKGHRTLAEARDYLAAHPAPAGEPGPHSAVGAPLPSPLTVPPSAEKRVRETDGGAASSAETPPPPSQRVRHELDSHSHHQVVFVDGACRHNGTAQARAGYGGYYADGDARNFALPVPVSEAQTNNRGELRATIHGIMQGFVDAGVPEEALTSSDSVALDGDALRLERPLRRLVIYTDSRYVIDGLTRYSQRWVENGFKLASKEPVLNQDLWKQLIQLRDAYNTLYARQQHDLEVRCRGGVAADGSPKRFRSHNTRNDATEGIELRHVKGHSNVHGNEMADSLAVEGSRKH